MSDRKHYTRICKDCGKVVQNAGPNMMRCPECSYRRDLAMRNRQKKLQQERLNRAKWEKHVAASRQQLHADVLAAAKAGMSYGKYMLTKNKKPARVTSTDEPAKG